MIKNTAIAAAVLLGLVGAQPALAGNASSITCSIVTVDAAEKLASSIEDSGKRGEAMKMVESMKAMFSQNDAAKCNEQMAQIWSFFSK